METLESWLSQLGLEKYADVFAGQEVGLDQLPALTDADLKELGLPLGPRKRILEAAAKRPNQAVAGQPTIPPAAERRQVTIMFVDLVGSTALSGRLDPEDLRAILGQYHETCAAVIARWGGLVAKLMGDGILAYFGWPQALETSAERAVHAGLEINAAVAALKTPFGEPMAARTGIATGLVVIGDLIGEGAAQEAAVAGETPNLAARLQAAAAPGGLVISGLTLTLAGSGFETEPLPPLTLKGFDAPVHAHQVRAARIGVTRFAARRGDGPVAMQGRQAELALLLDRVHRAASGDGQLIVLTGDAGMGKSHLAQAVLNANTVGGHKSMIWQCAPYHSSTAFYPVMPSLQDAILTSLDPLERRALDRLRSPGAPLEGLTPAQARHATLSAIGNAVVAASNETGLVALLVEDAHWIDPSTLEAIESNLALWSQRKVFVLVTARPNFRHDFAGHANVTHLSLSRLDRDGVVALAQAAAGGLILPREAADEIAAKADGVPLYVEETTRALMASGVLAQTDGRWTLTRPIAQGGVPASLADGLMARLDQLSDAKATAQEAAVIGRQFFVDEAQAIVSASSAQLPLLFDKLKDAQIIQPLAGDARPGFQFKHALLRDAAYDSLLKARRAALHAKFAQYLETRSETPLELRAVHVEASGARAQAFELWRRAGEAAMARPAYHEAIAHFRRALMLSPEPDALKVETRLGLAAIAANGHSHPDTVAIFEQASRRPQLARDEASAFVVWYGLWCGHHVRGEAAHALVSSAALHRASLAEGSPANLMMGVRSLGISALMNGDVATALARHQEAAALEDGPRDRAQAQIVGQDQSVSFRSYYGLTLWLAGRPDESWAVIGESVRLAHEGGHPGSLGYGLTHAIMAAIGMNQWDQAADWTAELIDKATEYRLGMWRDFAMRFQALDLVRATADDGPMRVARAALAARSVGLFAAYLDAATAEAMMEHQDWDKARYWLDHAADALVSGRESWATPKVRALEAKWAAKTGAHANLA